MYLSTKEAFYDELAKIAGVNAPLSLRQVPGALKKLDGNVTKELWKPGGGNIARVEQNQLSIGATKHPLYPKGPRWGVGNGKLDHYNETGSPIVEHAANQLHEAGGTPPRTSHWLPWWGRVHVNHMFTFFNRSFYRCLSGCA